MTQNPYDAAPYSSKVNRGRHIDRFATIAHLVGLQTKLPSQARILEIGCSTGAHLFPMAFEYPQAEFVGIDPSESQVSLAQSELKEIGLENVRFEAKGIEDIKDSFGTFDYIICHGVYSWVSDEAREAILKKSKSLLKQNGVAYVSYNTYPGWHLREAVRHMLSFYDDPSDEPSSRIKRAREVVAQILGATEYDYERPYSVLLHKELTRIQSERDQYLFHEFLSEHNRAYHFHEFTSALKVHGLRCIGDVRFSRMAMNRFLNANIPPAAFKNVLRLSSDNTSLEQTMDFLFFNVFRESLITHDSCELKTEIEPESIRALSFSAMLSAGDKEITIDNSSHEFADPRGVTIATANPYLKAAVQTLIEGSPMYMGYAKLLSEVERKTKHLGVHDSMNEVLTGALLEWAQKDVVEISLHPPKAASTVYAHPKTTPLIQRDAKKRSFITNLFYNTVEIGTLERELLQLLDGEHDKESLIQRAQHLMSLGSGGITEDGEVVTDPGRQRELLVQLVESTLGTLQRACLLLP